MGFYFSYKDLRHTTSALLFPSHVHLRPSSRSRSRLELRLTLWALFAVRLRGVSCLIGIVGDVILLYNNKEKETSAGHENKRKSQKKAFNNTVHCYSIHSNTPSQIVSEIQKAYVLQCQLYWRSRVRWEGHMTALYAEWSRLQIKREGSCLRDERQQNLAAHVGRLSKLELLLAILSVNVLENTYSVSSWGIKGCSHYTSRLIDFHVYACKCGFMLSLHLKKKID